MCFIFPLFQLEFGDIMMTNELKKFIFLHIFLFFYVPSILSFYSERNFIIRLYYISVFYVPNIPYVILINKNASRNVQSSRIYNRRHAFYKIILKLVTFLFQIVLRYYWFFFYIVAA